MSDKPIATLTIRGMADMDSRELSRLLEWMDNIRAGLVPEWINTTEVSKVFTARLMPKDKEEGEIQ
jgi:hypothetical protein